MSYHVRTIAKGSLGEISKLVEEMQEIEDAAAQGNKLLVLCELADLYGAIGMYLAKHHTGLSMDDLAVMASATARAFKLGERK